MLEGKKIVVVVPAYNVERQIHSAINGLKEYIDIIVIVDDCSKDNTAKEVNKVNDDRIVFIKNKENLGVGGATKEGFKKGIELGGDVFIKYDGDGQMDPERMEELIRTLFKGYDYTKGNRFIHKNELKRMPFIRLIGNYFLTFLTKLASGYWNIFDPQNGYIAINRDKLMCLPLNNIHDRYFFENDMLIEANIINCRIKDIYMPSKYGDEKSSLRIVRVAFTFPILLFKRFLYRIYTKYILYEFSPIGLFYFCGGGLLLFGIVFGALKWIQSILSGIITTTGTVMISVLPIILGFQLFLQGIVAEIQKDDNKN